MIANTYKKEPSNGSVEKDMSIKTFDIWAKQNGIRLHPDVVICKTNLVSKCQQNDQLGVYYDFGNVLQSLFSPRRDGSRHVSYIHNKNDLQIDVQTAKSALSSKLELTLHKDTELASIPKANVLSPATCAIANLFEEFATNEDSEYSLPPMVALVIAFIYEAYIAREQSPWYGYLQLFAYRDEVAYQDDPIPSISLPRFWTKEEKNWLKGSELNVVEGLDDSESLFTYNEYVLPFLSAFSETFPKSLYEPSNSTSIHTVFSYSNYARASIKVASRAFEVDYFIGLGLVPFADLLNHSDYNNACFQSDFDVCFYCGEIQCEHMSSQSGSDTGSEEISNHEDDVHDLIAENSEIENHLDEEYDEDSRCAIVAARDIAFNVKQLIITKTGQGDKINYERSLTELFNTYGPLGNDVLVSRYGFLIPRNRYSGLSLGRLVNKCIRTARKEFGKGSNRKRLKSSSRTPRHIEGLSKRSIELQKLADKLSISLNQLFDNWEIWARDGKEIFDTLLKCDPRHPQEEEDNDDDDDDDDESDRDWAIDSLCFQCRADEPLSASLLLFCLLLITTPQERKDLLPNLLRSASPPEGGLESIFHNSSVPAGKSDNEIAQLPRYILMNIYHLVWQSRSRVGKLLLFLWRLRQSKYHDGGINFQEYSYVAKNLLPSDSGTHDDDIHQARKRFAIEIITDEKWILDQAIRVIERLNS